MVTDHGQSGPSGARSADLRAIKVAVPQNGFVNATTVIRALGEIRPVPTPGGLPFWVWLLLILLLLLILYLVLRRRATP